MLADGGMAGAAGTELEADPNGAENLEDGGCGGLTNVSGAGAEGQGCETMSQNCAKKSNIRKGRKDSMALVEY
jgi:hypothetical protein